ncbi:MAG: tetratricopeptide repeat protein [Gemmatimonadaceae bacterium]
MTHARNFAIGALFAVSVSGAAAAQATGPKCEIDEGKPRPVKDAANAIVKAELIGKPEDKMKNLQGAVKTLTQNWDKIDNSLGRSFTYGKAMVNLATLPNASEVVQRGSVGFATNPEGQIDLLAAADTAFDAVEAANPACVDETEAYRRRAAAPLLDRAVNAYNARTLDSAQAFAERSLVVYDNYRYSHIAYNVLGNVKQTNNDIPGAIESFRKMVGIMAQDTSQVAERKAVTMSLVQMMTSQGEALEGEARVKMLNDAAALLEGHLKEFPQETRAEAELARVKMMAGDSSLANALFARMSAEPDKYPYQDLFEAGVAAFRSDKKDEAVKLFDAGLKKNPYYRDGLFNLATILDQAQEHDRMPPVLERLQIVDPENPEVYQLWALYYRKKAEVARDKAKGKPQNAPEVAAFTAINDSLLKYFNRYNEASVRVSFSLFAHDGEKHTLGGMVENKGKETKSYTLKFDFLNDKGETVTSKEAVVEGIEAGRTKSFRLEVEGPGIVAFKYGPLNSG